MYYHYLSLAKGGMIADNFTYKKVFYSIRGLMSAELATQQIMPELLITELFEQIDANDPLRHWAEDYLEIKKQQKEKAQLPEAEQIQILKLLNAKIEILSSRKIEQTNDIEKLKKYLTEYSFNLKQHFYG